jgi:hypothetical protein
MPKKCPTGYFCINQITTLGILFFLIIIVFFIYREHSNNLYNRLNSVEYNQNLINQNQINQNQINQENQINQNQQQQQQNSHHNPNTHHTHNNNPPTRDYQNGTGIPINIETRESGGEFQQIGILTKNTIDNDAQIPGNNTDSNILPLYGKQLYRGSNKWFYYTETDKYKAVKLPIIINNFDCTDDQGCPEISDGDSVLIPAYNGSFVVKLYKFNKPRYIPIL